MDGDITDGPPEAFVGATFGSNSAMFYRQGTLVLEDGTRLRGVSFGYEEDVSGELVFTTGMVGYPESLTDPSYKGQLLVMTYPIVGNYGVPDSGNDEYELPKFFESDSVQVAALIISDYSHHHSHWNSQRSLSQWLTQQKVPALYGLDTRLLTKKIRQEGALRARIEFEEAVSVSRPDSELFVDVNARNLVAEVSTTTEKVYGRGNAWKVLALDCGIKTNIIRSLVQRGCEVTLLPWDAKFADRLQDYDGLFLSNGPGDPSMLADTTIANIKEALDKMTSGAIAVKPLFGICLGNQMLGMAAGASTYKLPFGNRGQNQPVSNLLNNKCVITPQNHGYAIDAEQLPSGWRPLFENRNDGSNEGILHETMPWFSAQFHPEAKCGPSDTSYLFDLFITSMGDPTADIKASLSAGGYTPPAPKPLTKVLLLGSGGLSIGQAGEFDYSGSQAIKALKEEGLEVVLINPNIASVQTNIDGQGQVAPDRVYLLPVTPEYVEEIIQRERPEGVILSMGGQTGLNCGVELEKRGILEKYGVRVLGTSVASIEATEDRGIFSEKLNEINERIAPSFACDTLDEAMEASKQIGFPCMVRCAFALGGLGSALIDDAAAFEAHCREAFASSPQVLVEKSLKGWKEVEYEVVRDAANNCITVCNMENFDPLGVHTGDSIVIAPSQTLTDDEYHMLRTTAIKVVRHLGIVGECNIQYALDPKSQDYCIIEVNPRLSRSSALASKATGYPLAAVAAKLALGKLLPDLTNAVTQSTTACFEPSLDYIVVKVPRWDLSKFDRVSRDIGSAMKSVGEVMAIGRTFEESLQKALRMTDPAVGGFEPGAYESEPEAEDESLLVKAMQVANDRRIFALALALRKGFSVDRIHALTAIDPWFLYKLKRIAGMDAILREYTPATLPATTMLQAKKSGFSDKQIASYVGGTETELRAIRKSMRVLPFAKQIDTMAAEFPAATNYLYMTYNGNEHDVEFDDAGTMVLGSGVYRIGSSVEFDWCSVSAIRTLRQMGKKAVMVNYNPETVSTDYDECDRLYFEELSLERVLDIYEVEGCDDAVVSVGGQIPNTLALQMEQGDITVAGTTPTSIDQAEDRNKFSALCDAAGIDQPEWSMLTSQEEALSFCGRVGYPCLVRPSYVLSGAAMNVAYSAEELKGYLSMAADVSGDNPVVVSKFIENGREIDVDAVAKDGEVLMHTVAEHVENAGVHSGDATLMLPPQTIPADELKLVDEITHKMAKALKVTGPFNMQLIAKDGEVKVIECNLRASRSFPFSSKCLGRNFIETATRAMCGNGDEKLEKLERTGPEKDFVGVKAPMFSFQRLKGADPSLGVEMASTGEVACFGETRHDAFLKSLMSTGMKLPRSNILVSIQERERGDATLEPLRTLSELGYQLFATEQTSQFLRDNDVPVTRVEYGDAPEATADNSIDEYIARGDIHLVLMFSNQYSTRIVTNYAIRRLAVDFGVPLITNIQVASMFAEALKEAGAKATTDGKPNTVLLDARSLHEWYE